MTDRQTKLSLCATKKLKCLRQILDKKKFASCHVTYCAPSLKGLPGASSSWIISPSVYPFVHNFVLHTYKVQSLGGRTITKLGLYVHLRIAHTSLTSHAPWGGGVGIKMYDFEILPDYDFVTAWGIHVSQACLVSTEALELNNKIQQTQSSSSTQGLFQLPPGTLSQEVETPPTDVAKMQVDITPDTDSQVRL